MFKVMGYQSVLDLLVQILEKLSTADHDFASLIAQVYKGTGSKKQ